MIVSIINIELKLKYSITVKIQLWKGATPILIIIEIIKIISFFILTPISIEITVINMAVDAILWIIKYFIIDSEDIWLLVFCIIGINDIKETSNPIHIEIQLLQQIVIITPIIIL